MASWTVPLLLILAFGRFVGGGDLDYDIEGNIYVIDRQGDKVVKYTSRGDSIRAVSGTGSGTMQFDSPSAIYARRGNDIYIADYNNHRVQRFDRNLDYIATLYSRDDPEERNRFGYPRDVAVTRQGNLLVVDGENRRVVRFNTFGAVEQSFGDVNSGAGRLVDPEQIEVDERDNIYVLDGGRIVIFDPFGGYIRQVPLRENYRIMSIDSDTLLLADSTTAEIFALGEFAPMPVVSYPLHHPAIALRHVGGYLLALEQRRAVLYAPKPEGEEN
jgi:DNA-binding beta-propeller fold protein YncE